MKLKMNTDKTELILIGNQVQVDKCKTSEIKVGNDVIICSDVVTSLGAFIDKNLHVKNHINNKIKSAMTNCYKIRLIRDYLSCDTCVKACLH